MMAGPLMLPSPLSFRYLSAAEAAITADGIDDREDFESLRCDFYYFIYFVFRFRY